jgi:hypothetical protein
MRREEPLRSQEDGADVALEQVPDPRVDRRKRWLLPSADVDDADVGRAENFGVGVRFGVNPAGEFKSRATGFGGADQRFEPCCARGLEADAGAGRLQRPGDRGIDGVLVSSTADAQLAVGGEALSRDGMRWRGIVSGG